MDGEEDLLDMFADKICTLIEAYHLWSKGTSYITEFERFLVGGDELEHKFN